MSIIELNLVLDLLRASPWHGQTRIFGSTVKASQAPNDVDAVIDLDVPPFSGPATYSTRPFADPDGAFSSFISDLSSLHLEAALDLFVRQNGTIYKLNKGFLSPHPDAESIWEKALARSAPLGAVRLLPLVDPLVPVATRAL